MFISAGVGADYSFTSKGSAAAIDAQLLVLINSIETSSRTNYCNRMSACAAMALPRANSRKRDRSGPTTMAARSPRVDEAEYAAAAAFLREFHARRAATTSLRHAASLDAIVEAEADGLDAALSAGFSQTLRVDEAPAKARSGGMRRTATSKCLLEMGGCAASKPLGLHKMCSARELKISEADYCVGYDESPVVKRHRSTLGRVA